MDPLSFGKTNLAHQSVQEIQRFNQAVQLLSDIIPDDADIQLLEIKNAFYCASFSLMSVVTYLFEEIKKQQDTNKQFDQALLKIVHLLQDLESCKGTPSKQSPPAPSCLN